MTISNRHQEALARTDAEVRATTALQARLDADAELAPLRAIRQNKAAMTSFDTFSIELPALLAKLDRPGDYYGTGTTELPVVRIAVDGIGLLGLPIPRVQAEALRAAAASSTRARSTRPTRGGRSPSVASSMTPRARSGSMATRRPSSTSCWCTVRATSSSRTATRSTNVTASGARSARAAWAPSTKPRTPGPSAASPSRCSSRASARWLSEFSASTVSVTETATILKLPGVRLTAWQLAGAILAAGILVSLALLLLAR